MGVHLGTFSHLNYLAILVGTIAYWLLGAVWYAPVLFGKKWQAATGHEMGQGSTPALLYAMSFIGLAVTTIGLAFLARSTASHTLVDGIELGLGAGVAFTFVTQAVGGMYEGRPRALLWISGGYNLLGMILAGAIVTAWK